MDIPIAKTKTMNFYFIPKTLKCKGSKFNFLQKNGNMKWAKIRVFSVMIIEIVEGWRRRNSQKLLFVVEFSQIDFTYELWHEVRILKRFLKLSYGDISQSMAKQKHIKINYLQRSVKIKRKTNYSRCDFIAWKLIRGIQNDKKLEFRSISIEKKDKTFAILPARCKAFLTS